MIIYARYYDIEFIGDVNVMCYSLHYTITGRVGNT